MMFAMTEKIDIIGNKKFHAKIARLAKVFIVEMGKSTPSWRTLREKKFIFDNISIEGKTERKGFSEGQYCPSERLSGQIMQHLRAFRPYAGV